MFCKDDYVNYSTSGICRIEDIRFMSFGKKSAGHDYYVLKPINQNAESIFVPADNDKLTERMRPILTHEQIDEVILSVKNDDLLWIEDRKQRTKEFKEIIARRDERELLMLASCLYFKSKESKKRTFSDGRRYVKDRRGNNRAGIFFFPQTERAERQPLYKRKARY